MTLLEIVNKDLIINPLKSTDRKQIISSMVGLFCEKKGLEGHEDEIVKAILDREALGSTAMGKGIAIPHAKLPFLKEIGLVVGVSRLPVDFGGDEKSSVFFLVLASEENPGEHIQILSSIAKLCSSDVFVRLLAASKSPAETYQLFFD